MGREGLETGHRNTDEKSSISDRTQKVIKSLLLARLVRDFSYSSPGRVWASGMRGYGFESPGDLVL